MARPRSSNTPDKLLDLKVTEVFHRWIMGKRFDKSEPVWKVCERIKRMCDSNESAFLLEMYENQCRISKELKERTQVILNAY